MNSKTERKKDDMKKKIKQIENLWHQQKLDLKLLEDLELLNINVTQSKQIFIKDPPILKKNSSKVRQVKKKNSNAPLLDCRCKQPQKTKSPERISKNQIEEENEQVQQEVIQVSSSNNNNNNNAVIVISSDDSVVCLNDVEGLILEDEISGHDDQQSKTQPGAQVYSRLRQQPQTPRYLQYQPEKSSLSSLNFSQPLSASLIAQFMSDEIEQLAFLNFDEMSLSSLESKTPPLQNNIHYQTLQEIQKYFPSISDFQYQELLQAYSNDYKLITRILKADQKQIQRLLDKSKGKKKVKK